MAVYVDDMRRRARVGRLTADWSHLMADDDAELEAFARRLGLAPAWIQHPGTVIAHYDVTESKRVAALRLGAVPIVYGGEESKDLLRRRRAALAGRRADQGASTGTAPAPAPHQQPLFDLPGLPSALDFVAVDLETAGYQRGSICQIALVRVRGGVPVRTLSTLLRPDPSFGGFERACVRVHGITPADVADAPTFAQMHAQVSAFVGDDLLVAHNLAFERSALSQASAAAGLPMVGSAGLCTVALARKALPRLPDHKLPTVLAALGHELVGHHDALVDANAAAAALTGLAGVLGAGSMAQIVSASGVRPMPMVKK